MAGWSENFGDELLPYVLGERVISHEIKLT